MSLDTNSSSDPGLPEGGPPPFEPIKFIVLLAVFGGMSWHSRWRISPQELGDFAARGGVIIAAWFATAVGFTVIGHTLYGEYVGQGFIAALAVIAATLVNVVDICFLYRFPLFRLGVMELARVGLRLPSIGTASSKIATGLRILQGLVTGAVVGLFMSMAAYTNDISIQITADYLTDNKVIADQFAVAYDATIKRATTAVEEETASLRTLERQIASLQQNEVRTALRVGRKGAATLPQPAGAQLSVLEAKRTAATSRLDGLKVDLARLTADRNASILRAIDTAPNHKPKRDGFLGKLTTFGKILEQNPRLLVIVAAIELIALSLELSPVIAHAIYVPSTFAAHLALEHLKAVARMAREGAAYLELPSTDAPIRPDDVQGSGSGLPLTPGGDGPSPGPDSPTENAADPTAAATPKRKRGRPPKVQTNGHDPLLPLIQPN